MVPWFHDFILVLAQKVDCCADRLASASRMAQKDIKLTLKNALKKAALNQKLSLRYLAASEGLKNDAVSRELRKYLKIATPYGNLLKAVPLHENLVWFIACPFALLWELCRRNNQFAIFIIRYVPSKVGKLVLYTDGATPGNGVVAWREREITVFYWCIADLPAWYRKRKKGGWLTLGYLRSSLIKELDGGLSYVCRHVLYTFFGEKFNFMTTGMFLIDSNVDFRLQLRLHCFLQDGAAHKYVASIKGAGGIICCPCCKNITNTDPSRLESTTMVAGCHLQHFATAKPKDFQEQTHELFYHNADRLLSMTGDELKFAEKAFGIVCSPNSVIYDKSLRSIYSVPDHTYLDPMHILLTSSGIAQWELNGFVFMPTNIIIWTWNC